MQTKSIGPKLESWGTPMDIVNNSLYIIVAETTYELLVSARMCSLVT